ncbi:hypothetical protein DFH28DRAFT_1163733 [Melampsora americana]|nr:hypothetical protein DFH28DRAFT_1163733 [Melampsora americana]
MTSNPQIARKCGTLGNQTMDEVWAGTNSLVWARIAYLRWEAVRIYQIGQGSRLIWRFYQLVYNQDIEMFPGNTYFHVLEPETPMRLPGKQAIEAAMAQMEAAATQFGTGRPPCQQVCGSSPPRKELAPSVTQGGSLRARRSRNRVSLGGPSKGRTKAASSGPSGRLRAWPQVALWATAPLSSSDRPPACTG